MMKVVTQEKSAYETLKDRFAYTNVMQTPKVEKVSISVGVGKIRADKNKLEVIEDRLARFTGQKPSVASAKKSIAQFKVRAGDVSGYKVTMSGPRARQFLEKLIHVALPRTKDFRGIPRTSVDNMGNLTIGIKEHTIFPETGDEDIRDVFGLAITIVSSARTREEALAFFEHLGVPFQKEVEA